MMTTLLRRGRLAASAGSVALALVTVSACTSGASSGSDTSAQKLDGSELSVVSDAVAAASARQTTWPGPHEAISPEPGKKIVAITCGSQGYGCVQGAEGVRKAGEVVDWNVTVVDGKGDPSVWNAAVTQAVSDGADGIVLAAVNPALVSDGLSRAKAAGIPVISQFIPQFPGAVVDGYVSTDHTAGGAALADWTIVDSKGSANVLMLEEPAFPELVKRNRGILDEFAKSCPDCTIVETVKFSIGTMAQQLSSQVATALQKHPDINYVLAPFDSAGTFVVQGIRQSGRPDVKLVSGEGDPEGISRVRDGEQAVDLATVPAWAGWAAVDQLSRIFAGKAAEPYVLPQRLISEDNVPDGTAGWAGDVDYVARFTELWGK